ncbi:MAG: preprotein translocase subunit SecG [Candidatus Magasanikbacteria bacterium CG_4_9_14_0_2_um_filter_42_11]|uniref:Protein-export membrane protein SecG n=3 Tax=Candidatus Magasanikiibacteriota TaxID=1752731 RepID=A0A2M8F9M0_9BACT|nr:MAG: preprotein translocase subunit SecG [Candidatus Magasanikbacteria bacterium CG10_big_fil_rev_8_21_14_0_10_42_10]PIZ92864.1 MAG: preprotein translocase subunit SecG [Candidatus Magasanikbacteria bacterium CG_4_10_14_0_2_um_filter_41_10]PJC52430.1 MAG: preprotein translocase subunit SecG [Candidatus Magasanikbacteria bacterium CG_4_9_14_0_2_um_filter_42_11]
MQTLLTIAQMILGIVLIIAIMLQQKGAGLGSAFGGGGGIESTRRGSDLMLFRATIGISITFFIISLALVILS